MNEFRITVSLADQTLRLFRQGEVACHFQISTARNGPGEQQGSGCTPRGLHVIRAKIGAGYPQGAVFVSRRPTGEIYSDTSAQADPQRDWILTRILWLCGCEPGKNRF